jgi:hypothetical protein
MSLGHEKECTEEYTISERCWNNTGVSTSKRYVAVGRSHCRLVEGGISLARRLQSTSLALPVLHIDPTVIVKCVRRSNRLKGSCMLIMIGPTESSAYVDAS